MTVSLLPGTPVLSDPPIKLYKKGCVYVEGTGYVEFMDFSRINYDLPRARSLLTSIPFYTNGQFRDGTAPQGVYTFLVIVTHEGAQLVAKAARSVMELGTCHHSIASDPRLGIQTVVCGGELWKKPDGTIWFNLLSGDYTWPRLRGLPNEGRELSGEMADMIQRMISSAEYKSVSSANNVVVQRTSFINPENIVPPPDHELLNLYSRHGITMYSFPSKVNCSDFHDEVESLELENDYNLSRTDEERAAALATITDAVQKHKGNEYRPAAAAAAAAAAHPGRKNKRTRANRRRSLKRSTRRYRK